MEINGSDMDNIGWIRRRTEAHFAGMNMERHPAAHGAGREEDARRGARPEGRAGAAGAWGGAPAASSAGRMAARGLLSPQVSQPRSRYFFLHLPQSPAARGKARGLVLGGFEHCNPDYHLDRTSFAYHVIEYVVEGAGRVRMGGGARHRLGPGSIFVCRRTARCELETDADAPLVKYFLCLAGAAALARLAGAGLAADRVRVLAARGEVRSVMEDLLREGGRPGARAAEICGVLFDLLLLKIADAMPRGGGGAGRAGAASRENFLRCKALIDGQAERLATLDDIAAAARLDGSSVCRLFRRFQGISPYQYLLRRKMNLAAEFLMDGRGLVKEAAQHVGFADPLHFSRCFKAVHGVPPSGLRRFPGDFSGGTRPGM
jgi:AraC-like DNA-binding protein